MMCDPAKFDGALLSNSTSPLLKISILPPQKEKKPGRYCQCKVVGFVLSSIRKIVLRL